MQDLIDLHTHSTASDGSESPAGIVRLAKEKGLRGIALTDHDTVSGLREFLAAAEKEEIDAIPGVELSTLLFSKELHIVGLFIAPETPELLELLERMRRGRETRNREMILKLSAAGFDVSYDELLQEAGGESIGRPHIAAMLLRKGYFKTMQDAFEQYLKRGCRCYVPRNLPEPAEAIRTIHAAKGLAIWAHPVSGQSGERAFARKMLRKLIPAGLDGVEVRYSMYSEHQSRMMDELAEAEGILKSGGSDFHGTNQPSISLGCGCGNLAVPFEYLENMRAVLAARKDAAQ